MPIYEYECVKCGRFEELRDMDNRHTVSCPSCGGKVSLLVSHTTHKMFNPFTHDGEGFSSMVYSKEEARFRIKHNMMKDDKV